MKLFVVAVFVAFASSANATTPAYSPIPQAGGLLHYVAKLKCTCGSNSKELDLPVCTAPKKPVCVCSNPGNNPSVACK